MKKLENIPQKNVFNVPDGYFEALPGKIQTRVAAIREEKETSLVFRYKLQYALPVIALLSIGIFWFTTSRQSSDVDSMLASIQTEDLVAYLNASEITTEDLLENVEFNADDLEEIENEAYQLNVDDAELDDVLNDIDLEKI